MGLFKSEDRPAIHQSPALEVDLGAQLWNGRKPDASPIPPRKSGHSIEPIDDIENPWSQDVPPGGMNIGNFFRRLLRR